MATMTRRTWLAAGMASGAISVFGGLVTSTRPKTESQHHWQNIPPRQLIQQRHLPNVELLTQDGKRVHFYDDLVKDKKVAVNFIFTNCQKACPMTTANLVQVQKILRDRIGRDIFMYSITLQPREDTPKVLKHYAEMYGAGPGWIFLTGTPETIEGLRHSLGYVDINPARDADKTNHIGVLRYGNEPYMRWAACPGLAPADWIATSIVAEMDGPTKGGLKQGNGRLND